MRRVVLLLVLSLVATACGDDTAEPPATSSAPSGDTSSSTTATGDDAAPSAGLLLTATDGVTREDPAPEAPVDALAEGLNDAGFDLWRTRPVEDDLVFSPMSIGHALLMARAAADDVTAAAIDDAFGLPEGMGAHEAWNAIDASLAGLSDAQDDLTITVADRIWPRIDVTPDQDWIDLLVAQHGVTSEALDFAGDPMGSRDVINEWVSDRTEELIPELLPEGFIDPTMVLVLTDAVYLEARWELPFGKYEPVPGEFTRLDGSSTPVEFLRELELADGRGEGNGFVGAELPYVGDDLSMLLIVPDEGRFAEVRERLDHSLLEEIDATFTTGPFELLVPTWETTSQIDLLGWLTDLGAAPGRYPAITPDAFLGGAVHGADIAVDENGTVAAAATALGFLESAGPAPELTISADRPYLYLIRHRPTGMVLFAGQVTDPTA